MYFFCCLSLEDGTQTGVRARTERVKRGRDDDDEGEGNHEQIAIDCVLPHIEGELHVDEEAVGDEQVWDALQLSQTLRSAFPWQGHPWDLKAL